MEKSINILVYPVKDSEKAKAFYGKFLGVQPYVDSPYYVGYKVDDLEVGLDPNSEVGPIVYTDVEDIKASLKEMTDIGAEIVQDIKDVANGFAGCTGKRRKWQCCWFKATNSSTSLPGRNCH